MAKLRAVNAEIDRRLREARAPGSANRFTAQYLRAWARQYLRRRDEGTAALRNLADRHWSLILADGLFAVIAFWPSPRGIEFFCGTGDDFPVRHFCEHEAPDDPAEVFGQMRQRFAIHRGRLRVSRAVARRWLGRGW